VVVYADSQPAVDLAGAAVTFTSDTVSSSGEIDGDGRFTLTMRRQGDGALPGTYKVVIVPEIVGADNTKVKVRRPPLPRKYRSPATTDLTATVEAKKNDLTLTITAEKKNPP
jgi:hypothetical protein